MERSRLEAGTRVELCETTQAMSPKGNAPGFLEIAFRAAGQGFIPSNQSEETS
jgi:hypothetical protein